MSYNANGNINTRSDIGTVAFTYGASTGPYALTGVTSSTSVIPTTSQTATYTSFEKVNTLTEGVYSAAFLYNADRQRAKMDVTQSGTNILTRWYAGSSYIKETVSGISKEYTYLGGDAYTAPVAATTQNGVTTYYYLLRDYLGNITHVVNSLTTNVTEYSFDVWSRRRNPTDWSYTLTGQPALFADRGFTSHEFLSWFNLYNMNGRMYDPLVGRFLSADNYVQDPTSSQCYNRYSYGLNNPLKYSDPSGMLLVPNNPAVNAYFSSMQTSEFNNSGGGASGGGGVNGDGGSSWYNAYIEATLHGYTDGMKTFFNQLNSPKFNGTSYVYYTDSGNSDGSIGITRTKHIITLNPSGQEGVYDWGRTGNALGLGGIAYGTLENVVANKYWWMDARGYYNSTKILSKGANGKFIQGVQGYHYGYNSALNSASKFKVAGNIVGGLGIGVTLVQLGTNQITGIEAGVDVAFGIISFIGPIGAGIGATYFLGKLGYEYFSENTLFDKP